MTDKGQTKMRVYTTTANHYHKADTMLAALCWLHDQQGGTISQFINQYNLNFLHAQPPFTCLRFGARKEIQFYLPHKNSGTRIGQVFTKDMHGAWLDCLRQHLSQGFIA